MADQRAGRAAAGVVLAMLIWFFAPASAFKVQVAPGKTECISEHVGAEHFDVSRARSCVCSVDAGQRVQRACKRRRRRRRRLFVPALHTLANTQRNNQHDQVPGGPRVEGAAFVTAKSPHVAPSVSLRLLSPQGDQMWSQTSVSNEVHFNVAARGPGTYKAW